MTKYIKKKVDYLLYLNDRNESLISSFETTQEIANFLNVSKSHITHNLNTNTQETRTREEEQDTKVLRTKGKEFLIFKISY